MVCYHVVTSLYSWLVMVLSCQRRTRACKWWHLCFTRSTAFNDATAVLVASLGTGPESTARSGSLSASLLPVFCLLARELLQLDMPEAAEVRGCCRELA
jgi:hypothetical protein